MKCPRLRPPRSLSTRTAGECAKARVCAQRGRSEKGAGVNRGHGEGQGFDRAAVLRPPTGCRHPKLRCHRRGPGWNRRRSAGERAPAPASAVVGSAGRPSACDCRLLRTFHCSILEIPTPRTPPNRGPGPPGSPSGGSETGGAFLSTFSSCCYEARTIVCPSLSPAPERGVQAAPGPG